MKKIISAILASVLVTGIAAQAKTVQVTIDSPDVYTSDEYILKNTLEAAAYIENDITMIPLRFVTENLGASVEWNEETQEVTVTKDGKTVVVQIGSVNAYTVIGEEKTESQLPAAPVIVNDITLVPLRFISENIGATVEYIAPSRQVLITDEPPAAVIGNTAVAKDIFRASYLTKSMYIPYYGEDVVADAAYSDVIMSFAVAENWKSINPMSLINAGFEDEVKEIPVDELATGGILKASYVKLLQAVEMSSEAYEMLSMAVGDEELARMYNESYVCAKHILVAIGEGDDTAKVKAKAEEVLKKAKAGEDFDKLIVEYGEDPGMAVNPDGYLFTYGEMVKPFEEATFALSDNEISDIVETDYGYHIIKKLPLPELSEETKKALGYAASEQILGQIASATPKTFNMEKEELFQYMKESSVG